MVTRETSSDAPEDDDDVPPWVIVNVFSAEDLQAWRPALLERVAQRLGSRQYADEALNAVLDVIGGREPAATKRIAKPAAKSPARTASRKSATAGQEAKTAAKKAAAKKTATKKTASKKTAAKKTAAKKTIEKKAVTKSRESAANSKATATKKKSQSKGSVKR
ncbi:hypothetical protein [Streptomyces lavendofoliae]|uniref:hypothetical protein n=1 Tax=Streptomyces lavendofoliae TaxID=67314 RepID=UPI003D8ECE10